MCLFIFIEYYGTQETLTIKTKNTGDIDNQNIEHKRPRQSKQRIQETSTIKTKNTRNLDNQNKEHKRH